MQRLALYFDVGIKPWTPDGDWKDLSVEAWDKFFQPGISAAAAEADTAPKTYVLPPIDGQLKYLRRGPNVRSGDEEAIQEADVNLETVGMQITSEMIFADPVCSQLMTTDRFSWHYTTTEMTAKIFIDICLSKTNIGVEA